MSPQELLHDAARYKTWASLESRLMDLMVSGTVIEFGQEGNGTVSVTLDGTTQPVKFQPPLESQEPAPPAPAEPATPPPAAPKPSRKPRVAKPAKKRAQRAPAPPTEPQGVVIFGSGSKMQTEGYAAHVRRLVEFIEAKQHCHCGLESGMQDWFKSLS